MKKLGFVLIVVLMFGEAVDCDKQCGSIDMSGLKFPKIDSAIFGKGSNVKICPVSGREIKPGQGVETILSNGKRIMMCCPDCKKTIEADLNKYASFMY